MVEKGTQQITVKLARTVQQRPFKDFWVEMWTVAGVKSHVTSFEPETISEASKLGYGEKGVICFLLVKSQPCHLKVLVDCVLLSPLLE